MTPSALPLTYASFSQLAAWSEPGQLICFNIDKCSLFLICFCFSTKSKFDPLDKIENSFEVLLSLN